MNTEPRRVVLITGAAGGLGRVLVEQFAAQNWHVVAGFHRSPSPCPTDSISPVPLDVTNRGQVQSVVDTILERHGKIDALINNAGVTADALFSRMTEGDWDRVLDVNLKGAFLCCQAVLRPMCRQRDGHIINVSSFAARHGHHGQANYVAAKAGLIGLTQALAKEAGSRNVRVNAILPGVLKTAMTAGLSAEQLDGLAGANALRRINSAEEVARFTAILASMRNISGQVFQLDSRIAPWT
jgi:3-oxoacyl-[acyl-carrier protein] reductase